VYIYATRKLVISVHVNDIRYYLALQDLINRFLKDLSKAFAITIDTADALYLGMHIYYNGEAIKIY
jgi:hypothetical protein